MHARMWTDAMGSQWMEAINLSKIGGGGGLNKDIQDQGCRFKGCFGWASHPVYIAQLPCLSALWPLGWIGWNMNRK